MFLEKHTLVPRAVYFVGNLAHTAASAEVVSSILVKAGFFILASVAESVRNVSKEKSAIA